MRSVTSAHGQQRLLHSVMCIYVLYDSYRSYKVWYKALEYRKRKLRHEGGAMGCGNYLQIDYVAGLSASQSA
jgi:hypothetical protein